jgi:hypothetical protein
VEVDGGGEMATCFRGDERVDDEEGDSVTPANSPVLLRQHVRPAHRVHKKVFALILLLLLPKVARGIHLRERGK